MLAMYPGTKDNMEESTVLSSSIVSALEDSQELSMTSKRQYIRNLSLLAELGLQPKNPWMAISNHEVTIAAVCKKYALQPASQHMYATTALTSFKHVPKLKAVAPESYQAWTALNTAALKPLEERSKSGKPTSRQIHGWVPFAEIVETREAQPVGSDARLLLSMYTLIPSRRNDFARLRIYTAEPSVFEGPPGNYLVLPTAGNTVLVMTEYKTSRMYGEIREDLPAALVLEIRASLKRRPRSYLFATPRNRAPYASENAFSIWANRLLARTFRKALTLTLIRHAYITSLDFNNLTTLELTDIARRMQHSVQQQFEYKFVFK